jgi:hypothetical protein
LIQLKNLRLRFLAIHFSSSFHFRPMSDKIDSETNTSHVLTRRISDARNIRDSLFLHQHNRLQDDRYAEFHQRQHNKPKHHDPHDADANNFPPGSHTNHAIHAASKLMPIATPMLCSSRWILRAV